VACARQDLAVMHFYKSATTLDVQSCILIFNATSIVLAQVRELDRNHGLHRICPRFLLTATLLSLSSMARILKGPFAEHLDQTHGYNLFEGGVLFARSCSVQKGDYAEKSAATAERILQSKKVFRDPDGTINITLRIRNRLSISPWHDVIQCWKEEFFDPDCTHYASGTDIGTVLNHLFVRSGMSVSANDRIETGIPSSGSATLNVSPALSSVPTGALSNISAAPQFLLDDELWGDLGLGLSDNFDVGGSSINWLG
jgi:hypothetical protein